MPKLICPPGTFPPDGFRALRREQVRALDRRAMDELGIPGILLMENAGRGVANVALHMLGGIPPRRRGTVHILCASGNNGGDGFVAARHLANAGVKVRVWLCADPARGGPTGDAGFHFDILRRMRVPIRTWRGTLPRSWPAAWRKESLLIDALFGTGLSRPVAAPFDAVIRAMNASGRPILAVDLPSGMDCDTGEAPGEAVQATVTATMAAPKIGFFTREGRARVGRVWVLDIGVPWGWVLR